MDKTPAATDKIDSAESPVVPSAAETSAIATTAIASTEDSNEDDENQDAVRAEVYMALLKSRTSPLPFFLIQAVFLHMCLMPHHDLVPSHPEHRTQPHKIFQRRKRPSKLPLLNSICRGKSKFAAGTRVKRNDA